MAGPVCNVKGPVIREGAPQLRPLAPVPKATDVPSLVAAVQTLTNNLNIVYNFIAPATPGVYTVINNNFPGGGLTPTGGSGFASLSNDQRRGVWKEDRSARVTVKKKIKNPDDEEQYVEIELINSFTMRNATTGETMTWTR